MTARKQVRRVVSAIPKPRECARCTREVDEVGLRQAQAANETFRCQCGRVLHGKAA